ncbi:hypothetical protein HBA12_03080 [Tenacibaculum mesophilum]|uniref:hypothetical protein n=1 Tax=Tenacibaculum mesophilum TaxID=104268 RepID=UPI001431C4AB|nr:hypothetical protein [Tenacibaculum mesophilum]KAF9659244.1 hypothetical protein HBA12_03080 [Tenacibaculum mesophilum]
MITLEWKKLVNRLIVFFKNPIVALVVGILTSTFFYVISSSLKKPSYFITKPELIADKKDDRLKIQYDDQDLQNVYACSLILWNEGDKLIDYKDFIKDRPIKIYSNDSIQILSTSISKKSREDLNFNFSLKNNNVFLSIDNNEAIEEDDGVKFLILYSDLSNDNKIPVFHVESRIKETKEGFVYKDLSNYRTKNYKMSIYILWGVFLFFPLFRITVLSLYKKPIVFRKNEAIFIFIFFLLTLYETCYYLFLSTNLNWL